MSAEARRADPLRDVHASERLPGESAAYMRLLHSDFVGTIVPQVGEGTHLAQEPRLRELMVAAWRERFTAAISRSGR